MTTDNRSRAHEGQEEQAAQLGWEEQLSCYLEPLHDAWMWGYCDAGLRHRLADLCPLASAGEARPGEISEILMAWQLLRSFPLEYPLSMIA